MPPSTPLPVSSFYFAVVEITVSVEPVSSPASEASSLEEPLVGAMPNCSPVGTSLMIFIPVKEFDTIHFVGQVSCYFELTARQSLQVFRVLRRSQG